MKTTEEKYMRRCLELAKNGLGNVSPNPLVGCVIVHNDKIIGEGFHRKYGEAHAEVNAINSVQNPALLPESTLYVNLEPCAHYGKTPPCSNLIIEKKIPKVVVGCIDSFSEVAGKGVEKMQRAGIEVITGVLEKESIRLNAPFFTFHTLKRPYIVLKWAQTLDGFIDIDRKYPNEEDNWISSPYSKQLVHWLRRQIDGILIGKNTALNDNPQLTTRLVSGKNPVRLIIDFDNQLPRNLHIFDQNTSTVIFTRQPQPNVRSLEYVAVNDKSQTLNEVLHYCYRNHIQTIMVEGGAETLQLFIDNNLWDEALVFVGEKTFGQGLPAPAIRRKAHTVYPFFNDKILHFVNE